MTASSGRSRGASGGPETGILFAVDSDMITKVALAGSRRAPSSAGSTTACLDAAAVKARLSGHRVLVVDDDSESFGRIYVSLAASGCRATLARRSTQVPEIVPAVRPTMVIFSTSLDLDAGAFLAALRHDPVTSGALVIALAPRDSRRERRRLIGIGCDGYLSKPADRYLFGSELVRATPKLLAGGTTATASTTSSPSSPRSFQAPERRPSSSLSG